MKDELNCLLEVGIIEEVIELIDWCVFMVFVVKFNGKIWICVDLRKLNKVVKRERYVFFVLEDVVLKLVGVKVFLKLDVLSGYW